MKNHLYRPLDLKTHLVHPLKNHLCKSMKTQPFQSTYSKCSLISRTSAISLLALKLPLILLKKARKKDSWIIDASIKQQTSSPHDQHPFKFSPRKTTTNCKIK
ncbi:hypothetical protein AMTRI_Chr03g48340 [Amborella trichopoda]